MQGDCFPHLPLPTTPPYMTPIVINSRLGRKVAVRFRLPADTVGEFTSGPFQAAMRRTRREVRVAARASPCTHALSRTTFRAAAVATCCRWVFAKPT